MYRNFTLPMYLQVQAKDLQKMFTCHGLARKIQIYIEHDIRFDDIVT